MTADELAALERNVDRTLALLASEETPGNACWWAGPMKELLVELREQRERADVAERRLAALTSGASAHHWRFVTSDTLGGLLRMSHEDGCCNESGIHRTAEDAADAIIAAQAATGSEGGGEHG